MVAADMGTAEGFGAHVGIFQNLGLESEAIIYAKTKNSFHTMLVKK
jgi:hypothetical protein